MHPVLRLRPHISGLLSIALAAAVLSYSPRNFATTVPDGTDFLKGMRGVSLADIAEHVHYAEIAIPAQSAWEFAESQKLELGFSRILSASLQAMDSADHSITIQILGQNKAKNSASSYD